MDNLIYKPMSEVDLQDDFFNPLRDNYEGFDEWFIRKASAGEFAYTYYSEEKLLDFLYLKQEEDTLEMDELTLPKAKRLKVGTFKIERRGTSRGERFMKKILDTAIQGDYPEVYVTMFDDTEELLHLRHFFEKYGFGEIGHISHSNGRKEVVLSRMMNDRTGNIISDYPYVDLTRSNKYVLSIHPIYHTKLFSDSMLNNESFDILKDVSETNSIYKIYICWMPDVENLRTGDHIIIYRTNDQRGAAYYRSVATSLCTVVEQKTNKAFSNVDEFVSYCNKYSVFNERELRKWFFGKTCYVIKLLYNIAFNKRVIRKDMIERVGIPADMYWGFFRLSNNQFIELLKLGMADERYFSY